ncbi:hypothetical protein [Streptomyces sp. B6B3]|uniref:hypothetical protein n=1 Tax=Streptomyces sp. B6B3 TaxID=3153570 RepID=UPI00325F6FD1
MVGDTVPAFRLGAGVMTVAGLVALFLAVPAERRSLESPARPLSEVGGRGRERGSPVPSPVPATPARQLDSRT